MAGLYEIIDQLRREHPTPSATRTLDMVVAELGQTRENLRLALTNLEGRAIPVGGRTVLEELDDRARAEGVDEETMPLSKTEIMDSMEGVTSDQIGIAVIMAGISVVGVALVVLAILGSLIHL
ncbi:MAG TPA: hypothetical protein VIA06_20385 [Candidatus Dormibacteraeota bacterium]|jgi:hypothetical protein|nr:hypothetical protein [Candidatus Dormibacteraeota bacterium]